MDLKNIIPSFGRKSLPARQEEEEHSFLDLQRQMNRLFDGFLQDWGMHDLQRGISSFNPRIDMTEDEQSIRITAELPGMTDKDIDISLSRDTLTIKGEKKNEKEEQKGNYFYSERSFGAFSRTIRVPREIDAGKVQAEFRKGVLVITIAKTAPVTQETRKIPVKTG